MKLLTALFSFLILCLIVCRAPLLAQPPNIAFDQDAETLFQKALTRYIQDNYAEARQGFQELVQTYPPNQRTSAGRLMLAKTLFKLEAYSLAIAAAVELYEHFPYSRYLPEADLVIGDSYFHQGQTYGAATQYARILTGKGSLHLKSRAADRLGQMAGANRLTDREVERLKLDFGQAIIAEAVAFGQACWPLKLDRPDEGARKLTLFLEQYPNGLLAPIARQTLAPGPPAAPRPARPGPTAETRPEPDQPDLTREPLHARYKVGLIAPLESPSGQDLRDGILLARESHPLQSGEQVGLVFEDSEGDPTRAVKAAQRLIDQHNVIAIIGALTSNETTPVAALANALKVPLIAPTASEDGIASIGPYIFQINATPGAQGRRLAEYAVRGLGLRTLATLSSRDSYGSRITREFTARAEELGSEVIIQEWYAPGTTDYRLQFTRVREAGLALRMPNTFAAEVDSLLRAGMRVAPPPPVPVDPDTVQPEPVETLDGLLIAGDRDDILLIAPQAALALIRTRLLGSDGWNHPEVARDGGSYVEDVVFVAKYYNQSERPEVRQFVDAFRTRFGKDQNIVSALGHDAMLAILHAIDAGGTTRETLRERTETLAGLSGATGDIIFQKGERENTGVYFLTIRRGKIAPLPEEAPPVPTAGP